MNFEPRHTQAFGRIVVRRPTSSIVRPDATKGTTKYLLLDAVGPGAHAAGLRAGDVVVPVKVNTVVLENGAALRPFVEEREVALVLRDWASLDEFHVQTESGAEYVPFDDPRAAPSLGARAPGSEPSSNGVEVRP